MKPAGAPGARGFDATVKMLAAPKKAEGARLMGRNLHMICSFQNACHHAASAARAHSPPRGRDKLSGCWCAIVRMLVRRLPERPSHVCHASCGDTRANPRPHTRTLCSPSSQRQDKHPQLTRQLRYGPVASTGRTRHACAYSWAAGGPASSPAGLMVPELLRLRVARSHTRLCI